MVERDVNNDKYGELLWIAPYNKDDKQGNFLNNIL